MTDAAGAPVERLAARLRSWEATLAPRVRDAEFLSAWATVTAELNAMPVSHLRLLESDAGRQFDARLAPHQRRYLGIAERAEAEVLLADVPRGPGPGGGFGERTVKRLDETGELLDLGACSRVTVVGCGAFPAAALFFHERSTARIDALEVDRETAWVAQQVASRHASRRLEVRCADGVTHDYGAADTVYVVNQVTPKSHVLRRICDTAPPDARVLVRDPFGGGRLLAESSDRELPRGWCIAAAGAVDATFLSRHLVLSREARVDG